MTEKKRNDHLGLLGELILPLLRLLWSGVLDGVRKTLLKAMLGQSHQGLYRVRATDSDVSVIGRNSGTMTFLAVSDDDVAGAYRSAVVVTLPGGTMWR
jgi:hypothetical protein